MELNSKDVAIVRELAQQTAEITILPVQDEKRRLWRALNSCKAERPMVMVDQVCWNEMNVNDELTLFCSDESCREYEDRLRRILFQWKHFPVDMVVEPFIRVPLAITNTGFGIKTEEEVSVSDPTNAVVGHKYENQFQTETDLEKIQTPRITHDRAATDHRLAVAHELFDGILEIRPWGFNPYLSLWDPISTWMGVQGALYAMIDQPDLMHGIVSRMTDGYLSMLDQLEKKGLLSGPQSLIHCTRAWTDELPVDGYNPQKPRTKDMWMFGLAQMFSTVSPDMFQEFEVDYTRRICERFGLVYYGCCEPLEGKMDQVRRIPNVRKISVSPWADQEKCAAELGTDFVFSRKPNPALLAWDTFSPEDVREDLEATRKISDRNGCSLEFIQKDISTVRYEPERLFEWARIAMDVAES